MSSVLICYQQDDQYKFGPPLRPLAVSSEIDLKRNSHEKSLRDYNFKLQFRSKLRSANIFRFLKSPIKQVRFLKNLFLLYKKGPLDLLDLATSCLQICMRNSTVYCVR
jgi:hypothetical protein